MINNISNSNIYDDYSNNLSNNAKDSILYITYEDLLTNIITNIIINFNIYETKDSNMRIYIQ